MARPTPKAQPKAWLHHNSGATAAAWAHPAGHSPSLASPRPPPESAPRGPAPTSVRWWRPRDRGKAPLGPCPSHARPSARSSSADTGPRPVETGTWAHPEEPKLRGDISQQSPVLTSATHSEDAAHSDHRRCHNPVVGPHRQPLMRRAYSCPPCLLPGGSRGSHWTAHKQGSGDWVLSVALGTAASLRQPPPSPSSRRSATFAEAAAPEVRAGAPAGRAGCGDTDLGPGRGPDRGRQQPSRRNVGPEPRSLQCDCKEWDGTRWGRRPQRAHLGPS